MPTLADMVLRLVLVVAVLLGGSGCGAPFAGPGAPAAVDIAGRWTGRVELPEGPLDVGLTLTGSPRDLDGTLDVPTQNLTALPLSDVEVDGGTIRFTVPDLPGVSFAGTLAADASAIGGTLVRSGARYPLVLRRETAQP
jgi:hypothetical protein